ncbi:unnamed protein product [Polarella glacialis]|uniref:RRM domain-containing protein n=1 Tax=Polarella glacialis TaxID=89957 RepID=A0A813FD94_POLGL|nr:unnamed protein product [Polarella glacialis]
MAMDSSDAAAPHPCKIFVGNLPYSMTQDGLAALFRPIGEVIGAKMVEDRSTGKKKGFGFITFNRPDSVELAISRWHGRDCDGRPLTVKSAIARGQKPVEEEEAEEGAEDGAAGAEGGFEAIKSKKKPQKSFKDKAEEKKKETGKVMGWGGGDDDWA